MGQRKEVMLSICDATAGEKRARHVICMQGSKAVFVARVRKQWTYSVREMDIGEKALHSHRWSALPCWHKLHKLYCTVIIILALRDCFSLAESGNGFSHEVHIRVSALRLFAFSSRYRADDIIVI